MTPLSITALVVAWFALTFTPQSAFAEPQPETQKARAFVSRLVDWMDNCREQGDRSLYGAYACGKFRGSFNASLLNSVLASQPWALSEISQVAKKLAQRNLDLPEDFELVPNKDSGRFSAIFPGIIRFSIDCNSRKNDACAIEAYEWLLFKTALYCVATLSDMNDYHLTILRSPGFEHVAVQVFDRSEEPPARVSVERRIDLIQGRAQFTANDFQLEVDLPPLDSLSQTPQVEGRLVHFIVYGSPVQLSCHWRDLTTPHSAAR